MVLKNIKPQFLYWTLPALLFLLQLVFTLHSLPQLRYEELAESVRNVYWLEHRTIYDGFSSNVGWYGTLLAAYRLFGFCLYGAKFVRLFLSFVSLHALAAVLAKYFPVQRAWLPLLVFGLSPTLLYFNTLQTSYGVDLQYFPITLYLALTLDCSSRWMAVGKQLLLGLVAMWAWMSYPTFLFYLPVLGVLVRNLLRQEAERLGRSGVVRKLAVLCGAFVLPLALAFARMRDPGLLAFDSRLRGGIFRGAGSLYLHPRYAASSVLHTLNDLFGYANSYYFEVASVDFSDWYPLPAVCLIVVFSLVFALSRRADRLPSLLAWAVLVFTLIGAHLTLDPSGLPGMRRATPLLAAGYALVAITWYQLPFLEGSARRLKAVLTIGVLLILVHHLLAFPRNYAHLSTASPFQYTLFFSAEPTPEQSLDRLVREAVRGDLKLPCPDPARQCRYAEIYAAVSGACFWNHLACHQLLGFDEKSQQFIPLHTGLWDTYYWEH